MSRILLTLPDGRRTLVAVASIGNATEIPEKELISNNTDDTWALTLVALAGSDKPLAIREDIEELQNLINTIEGVWP